MKHTLVFHLIGVAKKLQKAIGYKAQPLALSYSQTSALLVIDSQKEISQVEIAKKLHLEPASIVTLVDELEKLKLVTRKTSLNNRRKYNIDLTEKGKTYTQTIRKQTYEIENLISSQLSPKDSQNLFSILDKLSLALDNWRPKGSNNTKPYRKEVQNELSSAKRHLAP